MSETELGVMLGVSAFGLVSWMCGVVMTTFRGVGRKLSALVVFCGMVYAFTQLLIKALE